ncbi:MAG: hypothetical protein RR980_04545, partial [Mucinivorans sp.]
MGGTIGEHAKSTASSIGAAATSQEQEKVGVVVLFVEGGFQFFGMGRALVLRYNRFKKAKFSRAGSEKRSFQEQSRKTNFSRADSEKRSFSRKVLGDFFK